MPARAHRAHGGAVVLVGPAVLPERPEVEYEREHQQTDELGSRRAPAARDRARALGPPRRGHRRLRHRALQAAHRRAEHPGAHERIADGGGAEPGGHAGGRVERTLRMAEGGEQQRQPDARHREPEQIRHRVGAELAPERLAPRVKRDTPVGHEVGPHGGRQRQRVRRPRGEPPMAHQRVEDRVGAGAQRPDHHEAPQLRGWGDAEASHRGGGHAGCSLQGVGVIVS